MTTLKLIVGLGNPGPQYGANRHNIGFQCVDLFARRQSIDLGKLQMQARTGEGVVKRGDQRQRVLLVKPLTYMNNSGQAVGQLARYYHVAPAEILVIHDDLDLDSGKLRLRPNGSSGGQNGIKSIIQHLGTAEFPRIRVGIGRPPGRMDSAAYVLQNFSADEELLFASLRQRVCDAIECWLFEGITAAMNLYNSATPRTPKSVVEPPGRPTVS
jgi:peptidyl-tRNA hydrolase, PTH1 family